MKLLRQSCACGVLVLAALVAGCGSGDRVAAASTFDVSPHATATWFAPAPVVGIAADQESIRAAFETCFATGLRGALADADLKAACASLPVDSDYRPQGHDRWRVQDQHGFHPDWQGDIRHVPAGGS